MLNVCNLNRRPIVARLDEADVIHSCVLLMNPDCLNTDSLVTVFVGLPHEYCVKRAVIMCRKLALIYLGGVAAGMQTTWPTVANLWQTAHGCTIWHSDRAQLVVSACMKYSFSRVAEFRTLRRRAACH